MIKLILTLLTALLGDTKNQLRDYEMVLKHLRDHLQEKILDNPLPKGKGTPFMLSVKNRAEVTLSDSASNWVSWDAPETVLMALYLWDADQVATWITDYLVDALDGDYSEVKKLKDLARKIAPLLTAKDILHDIAKDLPKRAFEHDRVLAGFEIVEGESFHTEVDHAEDVNEMTRDYNMVVDLYPTKFGVGVVAGKPALISILRGDARLEWVW